MSDDLTPQQHAEVERVFATCDIMHLIHDHDSRCWCVGLRAAVARLVVERDEARGEAGKAPQAETLTEPEPAPVGTVSAPSPASSVPLAEQRIYMAHPLAGARESTTSTVTAGAPCPDCGHPGGAETPHTPCKDGRTGPISSSTPSEAALVKFALPVSHRAIAIHADDGRSMLSIASDGTLAYGPAFTTTDAAARRFWEAVAGMVAKAASPPGPSAAEIERLEDEFIALMEWSPSTDETLKSIVIGNVRGFGALVAARLGGREP